MLRLKIEKLIPLKSNLTQWFREPTLESDYLELNTTYAPDQQCETQTNYLYSLCDLSSPVITQQHFVLQGNNSTLWILKGLIQLTIHFSAQYMEVQSKCLLLLYYILYYIIYYIILLYFSMIIIIKTDRMHKFQFLLSH